MKHLHIMFMSSKIVLIFKTPHLVTPPPHKWQTFTTKLQKKSPYQEILVHSIPLRDACHKTAHQSSACTPHHNLTSNHHSNFTCCVLTHQPPQSARLSIAILHSTHTGILLTHFLPYDLMGSSKHKASIWPRREFGEFGNRARDGGSV